MKFLVYPILFTSFLILLFSGCSQEEETNPSITVKKISGLISGDSQLATPKNSQRTSSLTSKVNEIWALKSEFLNPFTNGFYEDGWIQKFPVQPDGSFDMDINTSCYGKVDYIVPCQSLYLFMIDNTTNNINKQFQGFLSLDSLKSTVVSIPINNINNELHMGKLTLGEGQHFDEAIGESIETLKDSFNLNIEQLYLRAFQDDAAKMMKNSMFYTGDVGSIVYNIKNTTLDLDTFSKLDQNEFVSVNLVLYPYTTIEPLHKYALVPPGTVSMYEIDNNGSVISTEEFNTTNPLYFQSFPHSSNKPYVKETMLRSTDITIGGINQNNLSGLSLLPTGIWRFEDENHTLLSQFDLGFIQPINSNGVALNYTPSIKLSLNGDGKIYKVNLKWYIYDGNTYQKVSDSSKLVKQSILKEISIKFEGEYYDLRGQRSYTGDWDIEPKPEIILKNPRLPSDISTPLQLKCNFWSHQVHTNYTLN